MLWKCFWGQSGSPVRLPEDAPGNLAATSLPSTQFAYGDVVAEVRTYSQSALLHCGCDPSCQVKAIFERLWPEAEFLPPVPEVRAGLMRRKGKGALVGVEVEEEERVFELTNGFRREGDGEAADDADADATAQSLDESPASNPHPDAANVEPDA